MQKIRVSFDNHIFTIQKFGGISRYIIALFKEFDKNDDIEWNLMGTFSINSYWINEYTHLGKIQLDYLHSEKSIRLISVLNKLLYFVSFRKRKFKPDLYHFSTYDSFYFNRFNSNIPRVVTVHDMIDEIFDGNLATIHSKKHLVTNADLILANSYSTSKDIQKYYDIKDDKIVVTYLASSLQPVELNDLVEINLPEKYILYVGLREWYKNFKGFIEAIYPLLNNDKSLFVLCAGGPAFTTIELNDFIKYNINRQVIWKPIHEDKLLARYYQNALFFIFPSKYEGFGIPILEAMNCNCPVALSETSSLKEIADYAGYYFNPASGESIRNACFDLLLSKELREQLISKGKQRRKDFSWEITAKETIAAYSRLLSK